MAELENIERLQAYTFDGARFALGGISKSRLRQLIATGRIRSVALGKRGLLIPHSSLLEFLAASDLSQSK